MLRILVAEDNPINRRLVTTLLKKRGHKVTAVENGRAAVDAVAASKSRYDVVLMDLQMPLLGGLEATAAIRAREEGAGRRLPLIALTAHAMQGDRERCLAAGMDGYLSKPIDVDELLSTVERFGNGAARDESHEPAPAGSAIFDEQAALAFTGGDRRLLKEVVAMFRSSCRPSLRRIERALGKSDADALRMAAHALKGAVATVGSSAGRQAAADVERFAAEGNLDEARSAYATLRTSLAQLDDALVGARLAARSRGRPAARKRQSVRRKPRRS